MMADTASLNVLAIDQDQMAVRRTADAICHLLRDFIPDHSFRDASDRIAETAHKEGWELTNKAMRKEYEAWKKTQLELVNLDRFNFRAQDPKNVGHPPDLTLPRKS